MTGQIDLAAGGRAGPRPWRSPAIAVDVAAGQARDAGQVLDQLGHLDQVAVVAAIAGGQAHYLDRIVLPCLLR